MDHHAFEPPGETHLGGAAAPQPPAGDDLLDIGGDGEPVYNLDDQPLSKDPALDLEEAAGLTPRDPPASPKGLQERIAELESALADREAQLAALSGRTPLPAPTEAAMMVDQQRQQIERLTAQIAALKLSTDGAEMLRRSQRIAELSEALRRVGGDSDEDQETIDLSQRLGELNVEVGRRRLEAEQAMVAAEAARRQLEITTAGTVAGWADHEKAASREAKIAALEAQVEGLGVELSKQTQLHAQPQEASPAPPADPAKEAALQKRIGELEHALTEARAAAEAPAASTTTRRTSKATAAAAHKDVELRTKHVSQMNEQRQRLATMHAQLKAAEKKMKRRWARPRAAVVVGWMVGGTAMLAGASWMIASHYSPAVISASVDLVAKTPARRSLSAEDSANWQKWHAGMINDPRFHLTLAKRMAERRLDKYDDPEAFSRWLSDDLTVDASHHGRITLTLAGTSKHEVTQFLDILAITLASVSNRQVGNRSDGASAELQGERKVRGRLRFSTLNPVAILDHRRYVAGAIFGVLMSACIVLFRRVHRSLLKKRRIVTDDLLNASLLS